MSIDQTINSWRSSWRIDRNKHELGPTDDEAWDDYLNSLTMSEVLWHLQIYEEVE